ncbi:hypothetical protein PCHDK_000502500, partial [Plasmodium chabaudi adami]
LSKTNLNDQNINNKEKSKLYVNLSISIDIQLIINKFKVL